eukprot:CAMPEP_0119562586 /NCGR_PEP_ID=MMETSP1352-20130426/20917_1 /TAXON_ID=265584 /ORGANISM="Stauroneis constricta, Strain CCMP1120" /LENGTH=174 /DNA_ID=CAMNT_0007611023 /DNA_START=259 /DNA_END=778 /DNA_ORIENTATION=+
MAAASVVQFDGTLAELALWAELVPAEVDESVAEVSWEFAGSGDVLHDEELEDSDEEDDLAESGFWDGIRAGDGGEAVREGVEGVSGEVDVSWKVDSGAGCDLSEEGKHADASVLELDVSEAVELGLVTVGNKSQWVVEAQWLLGAEFLLEGVDGGGAGDLAAARGEGGSGGDEG